MLNNIYKITILLFLVPAMCQATTLTFTGDDVGTIDGGNYDTVDIFDTATVSMTAGSVGNMYIHNLGTLNFHNGTISGMQLWDSGTLNLEGALLSGSTLSSWGSGNFNLNNGSYQGTLDMWEYSHNILNDGQLTTTLANFYDYVITDVYGGNIAWDSISLHGYSELNIYGGDVSFNNGFNLHEDAEINVHYSSIIYFNEHDPIIIGYHLLDGSEFMLDQFTQSEIDQINFVPEPTTLLLLGLGGLLLRKRK